MVEQKVPVNWKRFNHPKIVFAEKLIPAGKVDTIQQHELKVSRDMVVDYLAISEETLTTPRGGGPFDTFLHWVGVNWGVVERATWQAIGFGSIEEFHNFYEGDKTNEPINPFGNTRTMWGPLRWRHSEPWLYNPIDTLSVDITTPVILPPGFEGIRELSVFFDGVGQKSGLRRGFRIPCAPINLQAPGQIFSQSFSAPQMASNLGDEPFKMQSVGVGFPGRYWCENTPDWRLYNFLRMRVTPSIGDSWSDTPVPLAFYGIHQGPPWRVAYHKPVGGPIFLYAGQSIVFQILNDATAANVGGEGIDLNVQAALIGRTAPGIGSLL